MAEVITSGKVIQKPEIVLDQNDFLPPGILGVRPQTRDEAGHPTGFGDRDNSEEEGTLDEIVNENPLEEPDDIGKGPDVMPIPTFMKIISQTVKVGADKKITLDVVIETDDFPGIREFEARITKSQL